MRILFVHRTEIDYTTETPYQHALGGTEAGAAYLSAELAKLGHSVSLVTNTSQPGVHLSVNCFNHKTARYEELFNDADVVIVVNEAIGGTLRAMGLTKPLVLWTGHAEDQPSMKALEFSRERKAWTGFAFVGRWQLERYVDSFWVAREHAKIMRNAVAPSFMDKVEAASWFQRQEAPILAYTSAPHRGLDVLLAAFPAVRNAIPGTVLRVFSSLSTIRGQADEQPYETLRALCLATDGVDYVGPISQPALAEALSRTAALAYPSTFAETSCIAAMEAMAVGAAVFTSDLGALPETLAGFGHMIAFRQDFASMAREFAQMMIRELENMRRNPEAAAERRDARIAFTRKHYTWPARAVEWQDWLRGLLVEKSAT